MAYELQEIPVEVVGSSKFGLAPKIGLEKTYNMYISDGWLINYPGYKRINQNIDGNEGRGLFQSIRGQFSIVVIDDKVFRVNTSLGAIQIGTLNTRFGEVFIDENLSSQICIVDGNDGWIYDYSSNIFAKQTLSNGSFNIVPGYVSYHNSFFLIAPSINDPNNTNNWYAFQFNTAGSPPDDELITYVTGSSFPLQTKPDNCLAVKRLPGKANHVLVIGSSVCEVWTNVGGAENYRRNSSFNIDSGCVSISTIAANEKFVCFLGRNENNSPTLIVTDGGQSEDITTDGFDKLLASIQRPDQSTAFFFQENGHLFYQITFYDPSDNLSFIYDFEEKRFYHVSDDELNFHPARQVTYFGERNIFISLQRGSLYEFSQDINGAFLEVNNQEGRVIPRIRVTNTFRLPNSKRYYANSFQFWLEQGNTDFQKINLNQTICVGQMLTEDGEIMLTEGGEIMLTEDGYCADEANRPAVDVRLSKTGNVSFSNAVRFELNPQGVFRNRVQYHRLGIANELTFMIEFHGLNRFTVNNGILEAGL